MDKNWFLKYVIRNVSPVIWLFPKSTKIRQTYEALLEKQVNQPSTEFATEQGNKQINWLKFLGFTVLSLILLGFYFLIISLIKKFKK